ncbi:MAG: AAA family ATPase, partial [Proteiniphilum sp.]|nr:AAA family ATPase [Proteiniphilum sp.]
MTSIVLQNNIHEAETRIRLCRERFAKNLDLSGLCLDKIPETIKDIHSLTILNLSENHLTRLSDFSDTLPATLEYLDVSYNKLPVLPESIGNLTSLETLNVRCNELMELPEAIGKLTMLNTLDISYNRISVLPESINTLPLEHCNVRGNNLQTLPEKIAVLARSKSLTLFGHMERIIELTGKNGLSNAFFLSAKSHIEYVAQKLNITPIQAVLFSYIVAEYDSTPVSLNDIANSIDCSKIKLIQYTDDFKELENRRFIRSCSNTNSHWSYNRRTTYRIPREVTDALIRNEEYQPVNQSNLSIDELFARMERLFEQCVKDHEISYEELSSEINLLLDDNRRLDFVKKIRGYSLPDNDMILLLRFCHYFVNINQDELDIRCLSAMYDCQSDFTAHKRKLKHGDHALIIHGFIENTNSDGFSDRESFKLTDKIKNELLSELKNKMPHNSKDIIPAQTIQEKNLFYNRKEADQIGRLVSFLNKDSFREIQDRLIQSGMRTGFACLFFGPPGTGKSETVYQLARQTGRDIMMVDISQTKSMWFGESERKIKEIFTRYRSFVEKSTVTPILLFNEADAVIGKRKDVSSSAVAQTENAIQNIILQELENLKGILIATTNLTENMDKAFERRFLYKVEFQKPGLLIRQSIWQSMITSLSNDDARELASRYDFSGGQIENIARKRAIDFVLSGTEPSLDRL